MIHLGHKIETDVSEELLEVKEQKRVLASSMLDTIGEVAALRRQQRGFVKRLFGLGSVAVKSPLVFYEEGILEPGQEVSAWLASDLPTETAGLHTQVVDEAHNPIGEPQLRASANRAGVFSYNFDFNDMLLEPVAQLELVTATIATVELVRDETRFEYQIFA
jgi:hypothetical protein